MKFPKKTISKRKIFVLLLISSAIILSATFPQNNFRSLFGVLDECTCDQSSSPPNQSLQQVPNNGSSLSKVLVVSRFRHDTSWLDAYFGDLPHVLVVRNNALATHNIDGESGHEAVPYLWYIINNYDTLADVCVFVHDHRTSWHCYDMVAMLKNLRWGRYDYMPLNWFSKGEPMMSHANMEMLQTVWPEVFQEELGPIPSEIHSFCCAQFATTRKAIRKHPKQFYEKVYAWLSKGGVNEVFILEWVWHYIFSEPAYIPRDYYPNGICDIINGCDENNMPPQYIKRKDGETLKKNSQFDTPILPVRRHS